MMTIVQWVAGEKDIGQACSGYILMTHVGFTCFEKLHVL